MTSLTTDEALKRVRVIQDSADFTEAAARLKMPITTLKTWARRNPKFVSTELYESKLQLTSGELTARRHSLKKAVAAAATSRKKRRRRDGTRPGPVKVKQPEPTPEVASPQQFTDAFFDRMMMLREQAILQAERIATLEDENTQLKYELYRTEAYRQRTKADEPFTKRPTDAMETGDQ